MLTSMNHLFWWVTVFLVIQLCWAGEENHRNYERETHPCNRKCEKGDNKVCKYRWELNYGTSMDTYACGNCPKNVHDCFNPRCISADGTTRMIVAVNARIPGPPLEVCHNDIIDVIVTNNLNCAESTTIHWHGLHMTNSPFMDGAPQITQCPILPQTSFQYIFRATEPGTHLWHAHSGVQQSDGVFGHIVVRLPDEDEPHAKLYDLDLPEHTIMVNEWGKVEAMSAMMVNVDDTSGSSSYSQIAKDETSWKSSEIRKLKKFERVGNNKRKLLPGDVENRSKLNLLELRRKRGTEYVSIDRHEDHNNRDSNENFDIDSSRNKNQERETDSSSSTSSSGGSYGGSSGNSGHSHGGSGDVTILINGKGKGQNFGTQHHPIYTPTEIFKVLPNKRYRFRFIAQSFIALPLEVSIDGHKMLIIATDGYPIKPVRVSSFIASAGERYDFVLKTNKEIGNYQFKVRGLEGGVASKARQIALIHYAGAPEVVNTISLPPYEACTERGKKLLSLYPQNHHDISLFNLVTNEDCPYEHQNPDRVLFLEVGYENIKDKWFTDPWTRPMDSEKKNDYWILPQINKVSLRHPSAPLLTQRKSIQDWEICTAEEATYSKCSHEFCECAHIVEVKKDDLVDIVLVGKWTSYNVSHPIHLHGYWFRIMAHHMVGEHINPTIVKHLIDSGKVKINKKNGVFKDSITVPAGGFVIVRFKASNLGYWLLHCHITFHHVAGMGLIFQVGTEDEINHHIRNIPENFPKCSNFLIHHQHLKL